MRRSIRLHNAAGSARTFSPSGGSPLSGRAAIVAFLITSCLLSLVGIEETGAAPRRRKKAGAITAQQNSSIIRLDTRDLDRVASGIHASVVRIEATRPQGRATASGFAVRSPRTILTSYHVVQGANAIKVVLTDGEEVAVEGILATAPERNLALLQLAPARRAIRALSLAPSVLKTGDAILAFGASQGFRLIFQEGTVSKVGSDPRVADALRQLYRESVEPAPLTWIESTAPVSPETAGGPLVNATTGQVVAVATWTGQANQNLAIASADVLTFINRPDGSLVRLDAPQLSPPSTDSVTIIPRSSPPIPAPPAVQIRPAPPVPRVVTGRDDFPTFKIGTAHIISPDDMAISRHDVQVMFEGKKEVYVGKHSAGAIACLRMYRNQPKLHGPSATFHENGQLKALLHYDDGQRYKEAKVWATDGQPMLLAGYLNGRKHGGWCMFKGRQPWLAQHWDKGKLLAQYLLEITGSEAKLIPESELSEKQKQEFAAGVKALEALEENIEKDEDRDIREFRKFWKEEDDRKKQELLTKLGPAKRRAIMQRAAKRDADNAKAVNDLFRRGVRGY